MPAPVATSAPATTAFKDCRYGRMLYLRHDRFIGRSLAVYGEWSELECALFAQVLGPGQVAVEVGANIGVHTLHLAKLVGPQGMVLAFEPQRVLFYLLCANLALNEQFHVRAYGLAVGDSVGLAKVPPVNYGRDGNFGGVSLSTADAAGEDVQLVTLDRFTLPSLQLLKIDVEGMEREVLLGARETIARHRPLIYVENDRQEKSPQLIGLLQQLGYDLHWHVPSLFNPDNFAGRRDNIFGQIRSINMLGIPGERGIPVSGARRVIGPDDWWPATG